MVANFIFVTIQQSLANYLGIEMAKLQNSGVFWGLLAVLLWSTVATAFKIALDVMTPLELLTIATTSSALALIAVSVKTKKLSLLITTFRKNTWYFIFIALLNPIAYYLVLFGAYDRLPGSQAQPINYTWAISLTILSVLFLGQRLRKRDITAALLGYFGVFIIATNGNVLSVQFDSAPGVALALLSTFLWATYWIISTKSKADSTVTLTHSFVIASILLWVFAGHLIQFSQFTWPAVGAAMYVGLFEMGITFLCWAKAMKLAKNTSQVANLIFISPFISLVLLHYIRGEEIYLATVFGLITILIALAIQQLPIHKIRMRLTKSKR